MIRWFAERLPVNWDAIRDFSSEPVPYHLRRWWWCLGGTPAYLFLVLAVTGILMTFYYVPDPAHAYDSVQRITQDIPFGWYIRSLHKWAANFMIVVVILHMMRVFFTGAYRRPRELNWMIGFGLLVTTLFFGFTGYSLVYEQLSYWGATVGANLTEAVPVVGPLLAQFVRGGETIGDNTLTRFFVFHIGVFPTIATLLIFLHLTLIRLHGVTEFHFEGEPAGRTFPFFPDHALSELAIGVFLMFVLTCMACVFPAEMGPKANPLVTPEHIKPEWYFYFTFRWLKLIGLTFAVLSLGLAAFVAFLWPLVDSFVRRFWPRSEFSVYVGVVAVVALVVLTLWETIAV